MALLGKTGKQKKLKKLTSGEAMRPPLMF